jgi:hypothetical protein
MCFKEPMWGFARRKFVESATLSHFRYHNNEHGRRVYAY